MDPATAGIWRKIPGYDGNSDSEDDEEVELKATAAERLAQIVELLGERYVDTPFLDFIPAQKPRHVNDPSSYRSAPHSRVWGPNGPAPCFKVEHTDAVMVRETFLCNGLVPTSEKDWLIQWSGPGMREYAYQGLHEYQRVNHFPGSYELTRKDRMWCHLLEKAKTFGNGTFDFVPETFVLPEQLEQFLDCYQNTDHLWIVKPHASSRGRGIFILRDSAELPLDELSVVSRYVDNPLLIQGLKWDLRVYVVVTGFEPLRAYVYREGLTRFASSPYSTDEEHLQDAYRHLTNYSINKSAHNFVENREVKHDNVGHKWSLSALSRHLTCVGVDVELMWARINDLIIKTLLAVEPTISSKTKEIAMHHSNCFEVYGFDVLVDEDLKPWLIEVNLSPSMMAESPLDWQVKSALLADTFNLVGVAHVDQQMISTSRLRSRLLQAREWAPPLQPKEWAPPLRRNSSSALRPVSASGIKRGNEKAHPRDRERSSADILNAAAEAVEPLLKGVNLDSLNEWQLKMLAHSLRETGRRHNFIRLYPTKATVRRYAALTDSRLAPSRFRDVRLPSSPDLGKGGPPKMSASQLLASLLFGPAPVRSAPVLVKSRSGPMSALPRPINKAMGAVSSMAEPEADLSLAPKAVKALGVKSGQRLLFMEYLVRVSSACESLSQSEKAKICQSPSYTRLLCFHRQLKQRRMQQEEGEDPEPGTDSEPELELHGGGLIDDLAQLCRSNLDILSKAVWDTEATLQDPPAPPKGLGQKENGNLTMEDFLPPSFASSMVGQKVVHGLVIISAADLERVLSGQQCFSEFRLDLRVDAGAEVGPSFFHAAGQWKEGPRQSTRRPGSGRPPSGGGYSRRGRQDRRHPQIESGPLHDLLRVPRDCVDPAVMADSPSSTTAGQRRPSKFLPGEDGAVATQAHARASPSPEGSPSAASKSPRPESPHGHRPSGSPPRRTGSRGFAANSRPMSALHRTGGARPPSATGRIRQSPVESATSPAERATGVLARSMVAQATRSEPRLSLPVHARSASALLGTPMAEALTPLRYRSSLSLKMKTSVVPSAVVATQGARPGAVAGPLAGSFQKTSLQQGTFMHVPYFNMDIEL